MKLLKSVLFKCLAYVCIITGLLGALGYTIYWRHIVLQQYTYFLTCSVGLLCVSGMCFFLIYFMDHQSHD